MHQLSLSKFWQLSTLVISAGPVLKPSLLKPDRVAAKCMTFSVSCSAYFKASGEATGDGLAKEEENWLGCRGPQVHLTLKEKGKVVRTMAAQMLDARLQARPLHATQKPQRACSV